jgi:cob(I)alamin adenosyltransferase
MPRITKVTTRRGDDGFTDLADGKRVRKDSLRIRAIGALDELNSAIGAALAQKPGTETAARLRQIQNDLLCLGAMLARNPAGGRRTRGPEIDAQAAGAMERESASLQKRLGPLENFLLPGGTPAAAGLHLARTICRRAEREVAGLGRREPVSPTVRIYLNRLSDLLFQYARVENRSSGTPETFWNSL